MAFDFLIPFGALYIAAQTMSKSRLSPFKAALVFTAVVLIVGIITWLTIGLATEKFGNPWSPVLVVIVKYALEYIVAAATLFVMDRYEDTIVAWNAAFVVGYLTIAFVV